MINYIAYATCHLCDFLILKLEVCISLRKPIMWTSMYFLIDSILEIIALLLIIYKKLQRKVTNYKSST